MRVCAWKLRKLFRTGGYSSQVAGGVFRETVLKSSLRLRPGAAAEIQSQYVAYRDSQGNHILEAHRIVMPNGTLGGSGEPDPKKLIHGGVVYYVGAGPCPCDEPCATKA